MSSQDTEGDEEVSAFFRNVQEIRAEELLPTEVMDKLKKLEDSVENLSKQFVIVVVMLFIFFITYLFNIKLFYIWQVSLF
ncbi:uncharacterized protein LOC124807541 isoform X2 [Hydra vulgaris]|uniref:uncharacterized protein LOC124807541 isoform X2 n=1 Tax=Hydra vulgaris TaxID=6087 RepID=UPI0032EA8CD3